MKLDEMKLDEMKLDEMKLAPKYERLEKIAQMATKAHSKELAPGPKPEITMGMVIEVLRAAEKLDASVKRKQVKK